MTRSVASALGSPPGVAWTFALGTLVGSSRAGTRASAEAAAGEHGDKGKQADGPSLASRLLAIGLWLNNAYRLAQTPEARAAVAALLERRAAETADREAAVAARRTATTPQ